MSKPIESLAETNELLRACGQKQHLFQLYSADARPLAANVGRYLAEGFHQGATAIIIAAPHHAGIFCEQLKTHGIDPESAIRERRLEMLDAEETLARFMVDGYPDAECFETHVGSIVRAASSHGAVRAYGEMVGILWEQEQYPAAIRLEQLWNRLRQAVTFDLFCAYPIDVFGKQFELSSMAALLGAHTHLLPSDGNLELAHAVKRAIADVLGPVYDNTYLEEPRFPVPSGEGAILWLRKHHPEKADDILQRAERYYQASA